MSIPHRPVEVTGADLQEPGIAFCPNPKMPVWRNHPRVFIDLRRTGSGKCPYCGTEYRLAADAKLGATH